MHPSRRHLLAALPIVALAAACAKTPEEIRAQAGAPPRPAGPDEALAVLMEGNARFTSRQPQIRETADIEVIWTAITQGQEPFATILTCADSRLGPELIFDQFVGDIFVVREAGNIAGSPTNLGSLEYGQAVLTSKLILVLGHSKCGAVQAAYDKASPGANIQAVVDAIAPGIAGATDLDDAITRNVRAVVEQIRARSPLLRDAEAAGALRIVGAVYDIATANVTLL